MEDNKPEAATRIRANQEKLAARLLISQQTLATELKPHYDFIVCGSGFSGSVVQRRLAENSGVRVLLLKADGTDEYRMSWKQSNGSRIWGPNATRAFIDQPNPHLNGRAIPLNMRKVLGCVSSINVMAWSRITRASGNFSQLRPVIQRFTCSNTK